MKTDECGADPNTDLGNAIFFEACLNPDWNPVYKSDEEIVPIAKRNLKIPFPLTSLTKMYTSPVQEDLSSTNPFPGFYHAPDNFYEEPFAWEEFDGWTLKEHTVTNLRIRFKGVLWFLQNHSNGKIYNSI